MPVTGTNNFTVTRNEIIEAALRALNVYGAGESPNPEDYQNCSQALNLMIKSWAKKGLPLWTTEEVILPLVEGIGVYPLGPSAGYLDTKGIRIIDGGSAPTDGTFNLAITDAGGGTGATGTFEVEDNTITEITITNPGSGYVSPVLSFADGSVTDENVSVTVVGITMSRPLQVFEAFLRYNNNLDRKLWTISRNEYNVLSPKNSLGSPNLFYYDNQLPNGRINLFNVPFDSTTQLHLQLQRQFFDMNNPSDAFDFPQEWFNALKWGLAAELAVEYATEKEMLPYYETKATTAITECFDDSVEESSVLFTYRSH
jgi:hypothetical protein